MKLYCILLFGLAMSMTVADNILATTFEVCAPGEWLLTNTTIHWSNDKKEIVTNASYSPCTSCPVYTIRIVIDNCVNHTNCTGEPMWSIDRVDCNSDTINETDIDICKVAQEAATLEKQKEWLTYRYGMLFGLLLYDYKFCIDLTNSDISLSINSDELSESSESSESRGMPEFHGMPESHESHESHEPHDSHESHESHESGKNGGGDKGGDKLDENKSHESH